MYAVEATIQLSLAKNVAERILLLLSLNSNVCSRQGPIGLRNDWTVL